MGKSYNFKSGKDYKRERAKREKARENKNILKYS